MAAFKILLTGITGFIGNRLADALLQNGHEIHANIRYRAAEDFRVEPHRIKEVNYHTCNLNDHLGLRKQVLDIEPEIIIHLAALSPVRHSFVNPIEYQHTNYLATINLVHLGLDLDSLKKFIFASTMETYGWQKEHKPFTEDLRLNPASPYAVSKVAAEKYIQMAGEAYGLPFLIAKPCNTFGRKRSTSFITEYLVKEMLNNRSPKIGSPEAVRDMMYASDHVSAYLALINTSISQETFNFGNGLTCTMLELTEMIKEKIGFNGNIESKYPSDYPNRPFVDPYLSLDSTKAEKMLNWKPKVSLDEGLNKTIDFWRDKI